MAPFPFLPTVTSLLKAHIIARLIRPKYQYSVTIKVHVCTCQIFENTTKVVATVSIM